MNRYLIPSMILVIFALFCAGCTETGSQGTGITATPTPLPLTTAVPSVSPSAITTLPTLSLGNQYLSRSYAFSGLNNTYSEQIRIADPSWAISYKVTELTNTSQDCQFAIKVTNLDSMNSQTYTWTYLNDSFQQYPMYTPGLYKFALTGSLVKVDLTVAQRLP
ncbi:hypothetical protein Mboo_0119 [Methanoregula boonei 6A8]|jgi:DUF971 family protein|uniref:Uncharacterized protein n=1 Tax=Methanoregula boonei (strain DSM 21154 / JCM 14090 / 6A8) TaxID=456442 RepID=A7I4I2_METB6|nr:hypothetical protein [Methanoregula boonei]ABS54643.1 hypothetical protein Mboo_0119 [Methanoregula boonei 6A8]